MRMRLMFTKNGELIAEAEAEVVGKGDMAKGTCIVLEDVRRLRPDVGLLDEDVTVSFRVTSQAEADRTDTPSVPPM